MPSNEERSWYNPTTVWSGSNAKHSLLTDTIVECFWKQCSRWMLLKTMQLSNASENNVVAECFWKQCSRWMLWKQCCRLMLPKTMKSLNASHMDEYDPLVVSPGGAILSFCMFVLILMGYVLSDSNSNGWILAFFVYADAGVLVQSLSFWGHADA